MTRTKTAKNLSILAWIMGLIFLSACNTPASIASTEQEDILAQINFAEVEVGLGSPTPVTVTIDVTFPNACSQISEITQSLIKDNGKVKILIEVRVADMGEICTDFPQSFRVILPINASGLPKGLYSVEVNGADAGSFEFEN